MNELLPSSRPERRTDAPSWLRRVGHRFAFALALAAALVGCGAPEPYETKGGAPVRLDGADTELRPLTIARALELSRRRPVFVRGYLVVPVDDVSRLCARLSKDGRCEEPSLVLVNRHDHLRELAAAVLEHGCCATGSWAPRPVAVRVRLRPGHRAVVIE